MSYHRDKRTGQWFVVWWEPQPTGNPKQKRRYTGTGDEGKQIAKDLDADLSKKRSEERTAASSAPTFMEVAQLYIHKGLSEKSRESIGQAINKWVANLFGNKPVDCLSMADLVALDQRLAMAKKSQSTRNRYRSYCRAILQWGLDNDLYAGVNPFAKYRPDLKREGKAQAPPTQREIDAIMFNALPHLRWVIQCIINTGFRPGPTELYKVQMSDVDYERCGIWIQRSKDPKSPPVLQPVLPGFLEEIKALKAKHPGRRWLVEYKGKQVQKLKRTLDYALKASCILPPRRIRLYDFRHLYITKLIEAGADVKAVSELAGHTDTRMVMQVYYHLGAGAKRQALNKMPELYQYPYQYWPENSPKKG